MPVASPAIHEPTVASATVAEVVVTDVVVVPSSPVTVKPEAVTLATVPVTCASSSCSSSGARAGAVVVEVVDGTAVVDVVDAGVVEEVVVDVSAVAAAFVAVMLAVGVPLHAATVSVKPMAPAAAALRRRRAREVVMALNLRSVTLWPPPARLKCSLIQTHFLRRKYTIWAIVVATIKA